MESKIYERKVGDVLLCNLRSNMPILLFVPSDEDKKYTHTLNGSVWRIESWDEDDIPLTMSFVAEFSIKWDGCSHIVFKGEGYPVESDSYYHLCGVGSYLLHMRAMVFAYKLMMIKLGDTVFHLEVEDYNEQMEPLNLLEGYEIRWVTSI
jgi:hypothetical protein